MVAKVMASVCAALADPCATRKNSVSATFKKSRFGLPVLQRRWMPVSLLPMVYLLKE